MTGRPHPLDERFHAKVAPLIAEGIHETPYRSRENFDAMTEEQKKLNRLYHTFNARIYRGEKPFGCASWEVYLDRFFGAIRKTRNYGFSGMTFGQLLRHVDNIAVRKPQAKRPNLSGISQFKRKVLEEAKKQRPEFSGGVNNMDIAETLRTTPKKALNALRALREKKYLTQPPATAKEKREPVKDELYYANLAIRGRPKDKRPRIKKSEDDIKIEERRFQRWHSLHNQKVITGKELLALLLAERNQMTHEQISKVINERPVDRQAPYHLIVSARKKLTTHY